MPVRMMNILMLGFLIAGGTMNAAFAQAGKKQGGAALDTFGGSGGEPIKITSDQLDVFDKDGKAVFIGNVIAIQGKSTMKCSKLEVFYNQSDSDAQSGTEDATSSASSKPKGLGMPSDSSSIKQIECLGPVTIVSETQVATGDHATFNRQTDKVHLRGNVVLKDGANVSKGDRLVYDVNTGIAKIEGRVRTMFLPDSSPNP